MLQDYYLLLSVQKLTGKKITDLTQPPNVQTAWNNLRDALIEPIEIILANLPQSELHQEIARQNFFVISMF